MTETTSRRRARRGLVVYQLVLILLAIIGIVVGLTCYARHKRAATPGAKPGVGGGATANRAPPSPLEMAVKPTPQQQTFQGCPPEGDNPRMAELNRLKNRVDEGQYRAVPIDSLLALQWPKTTERFPPARWSAADRAAVEHYQGIPVAVEGYLAGAKESGPESPNCHGADNAMQDWHVWLAPAPGTDRTHSMVVETTPRVRATHPAWRLTVLRRIARQNERVRVSGWLLFDPEHPDQLGKTRGTLWEIHPIMRLEVQRGGRWLSLDSLPPTR